MTDPSNQQPVGNTVPMPSVPLPPESGNGTAGAPGAGGKSPKRKRAIIIGVVVAVALVAAGGGIGWKVYSDHAATTAMSDCKDAAGALSDERVSARKLIAKAQKALDAGDDSVADAAVLTSLKKAVESVDIDSVMPSCAAGDGTQSLRDNGEKAKTLLNKLKQSVKATNKALTAAENSKAEKSLSDAKATLQSKVDEAQQVYDSSEGKVSDDTSRDALRTLIDKAKSLLADAKADAESVAALEDEAKKFDDAVSAVNGSVEAKKQADDQSRCAAIVGEYAPPSSGGGPTINASCGISGQGGSAQYVSGSYQDLGGGMFSWQLSDGTSMTYYPAGVAAPQQSSIPTEMMTSSGITNPTGTPKVVRTGGMYSSNGGSLLFKP